MEIDEKGQVITLLIPRNRGSTTNEYKYSSAFIA